MKIQGRCKSCKSRCKWKTNGKTGSVFYRPFCLFV